MQQDQGQQGQQQVMDAQPQPGQPMMYAQQPGMIAVPQGMMLVSQPPPPVPDYSTSWTDCFVDMGVCLEVTFCGACAICSIAKKVVLYVVLLLTSAFMC